MAENQKPGSSSGRLPAPFNDVSRFAENLRHLMQTRGVSPKALSRATGIPTSTLSEWTGGREPRLSGSLIRLAKFFGVTLEYLVTGDDPKPADPIGELTDLLEDGFVTVHQGVYRVTIERGSPPARKKRGDQNRKGGE